MVLDRRLARAAGSLYRNLGYLTAAEGRIERASALLRSYLAERGLTTAALGLYQVELVEEVGGLAVTRDSNPDADPVATEPAGDPGLLSRAAAGQLPCPRCTAPLSAEPFQIGGTPEVRLYCTSVGCGFEEF